MGRLLFSALSLVLCQTGLACGFASSDLAESCTGDRTPVTDSLDGNHLTQCGRWKNQVMNAIGGHCDNGNNYGGGAGPGFQMTENTMYCCNQDAFIRAVSANCCWVYRATFNAVIDVGTCFVDSCNAARRYFTHNAGSGRWALRIGSQHNGPLSNMPQPPSIQAWDGVHRSGPSTAPVHLPLQFPRGMNGFVRQQEWLRRVQEERPEIEAPIIGD